MDAQFPPADFGGRKFTASRAAPLSGAFNGLGVVGVLMVLGIFFLPLMFIAFIAAPFLIGGGLFVRVGACPNCGAAVSLVGSATCSDCKHRLVLRSKRIVDFS